MKSHKKKEKKTVQQDKSVTTIIILGIMLLIIAVFGVSQTMSLSNIFNHKIIVAKEAARPAIIELSIITDSNCENCFDINQVIEYVKGKNVNITKSSNYNTNNGLDLLEKYSINKLPALIITGETDKVNLKDFENQNGDLVYIGVTPPFTDTATMDIKGEVITTLISADDCPLCVNLQPIIGGLKEAGVTVISEESISYDSLQGKKLINEFGVDSLPVIFISNEIEAYGSNMISQLQQTGFVKKNELYTFNPKIPPYVDLSTNNIKGLVSLTYITDNSCTRCYDPVSIHKSILQRMGIVIGSEDTFDISSSEGQELISKYSIKNVPTVVIQGDIALYPTLVGAWPQVGTKETDGAYVFRNINVIAQVYKDLEQDKIINPQVQG